MIHGEMTSRATIAARAPQRRVPGGRSTPTRRGRAGSAGTTPASRRSGDPTPYRQLFGKRLREVRVQRGLTLQEVEDRSASEFTASALCAYERGDRSASVARLQRLAQFYRVPVSHLLPASESNATTETDVDLPAPVGGRRLSIDIAELSTRTGHPLDVLNRYLLNIQVRRQDFNGRVITLRESDCRSIAGMLGCSPDRVHERLDDLGLVFRSS